MSGNRTVLITGGSSGIGRGIACAFAREGYDIAFTYGHNKENAEDSARILKEINGKDCVVIQGLMEREEVPAQVAKEAIDGLGHIDVLINNAGRTMFDNILKMPLETLNELINLDFKSYILMVQAVGLHMKEKGIQGNIINVTSARAGRAHPGDSVYGGLKKGLERATESLALDLAPFDIRVNAISPGATVVRDLTKHKEAIDFFCERIPMKRMAVPEDIGNAAVFLASDKASYITGQTLNIDGGLNLPGMPEVQRHQERNQAYVNWANMPLKDK